MATKLESGQKVDVVTPLSWPAAAPGAQCPLLCIPAASAHQEPALSSGAAEPGGTAGEGAGATKTPWCHLSAGTRKKKERRPARMKRFHFYSGSEQSQTHSPSAPQRCRAPPSCALLVPQPRAMSPQGCPLREGDTPMLPGCSAFCGTDRFSLPQVLEGTAVPRSCFAGSVESEMPRLELPRVDKVPPEDPLQQVLPGCGRGELQAGAAPRTALAKEPPVPLLCLLAFQSRCYPHVSGTSGHGKPCWDRAASVILVTAGTGTRLLVVPPAASHPGVSLSTRNPGMSAASRLLLPAGTCPGSGTPRVA